MKKGTINDPKSVSLWVVQWLKDRQIDEYINRQINRCHKSTPGLYGIT